MLVAIAIQVIHFFLLFYKIFCGMSCGIKCFFTRLGHHQRPRRLLHRIRHVPLPAVRETRKTPRFGTFPPNLNSFLPAA